MLLKQAVLQAIEAGDVDLVFRRQKRPTVKKGGTLKTKIGVLEILAVDAVEEDAITTRAARRAGFDSAQDVLDSMAGREGTLYRVRVKHAGEDPRIALRNDAALDEDTVADLEKRMQRYDAASSYGAWTERTLRLIAKFPARRAPELAELMGRETKPFKTDVRKLKALGLTESLKVGYRLSPRGEAFLERAKWPRS
ncbi:MAG: hypothetical protein RIT81_20050 [Deltaproteobacteria bacterium]